MTALHDAVSNYTSWIVAAHIIAVIAWMSGMLYLPRLFVYHAQTEPGSESSERFKIMERRLLKAITTPAMIAVWILGLLLAWLTGAYAQTWLQIKFFLVILLSALHGLNIGFCRQFQADERRHKPVFFRVINEAPTLLMVLIVILAVVKPFGG